MYARLITILLFLGVNLSFGRTLVTCHVFAGRISSVAFKSARQMNNVLQDRFPEHKFELFCQESFEKTTNKTEALIKLVEARDCHVIISYSQWNFLPGSDDQIKFAQKYPDRWLIHTSPQSLSADLPNLGLVVADAKEVWYQIGAIAGAQSKSCVGIIFPAVGSFVDLLIDATVIGMKRSGSTAGVVALPIGAFVNFTMENLATELLVKYGCDIIVHWTGSRVVDLYVANLKNSSIMSVGANDDAFLLVDDSVLTCMVPNNFGSSIAGLVEPYVLGQSIPRPVIWTWVDFAGVANLSPRASAAARAAKKWAVDDLHAHGDEIFCVDELTNVTPGHRCPTPLDALDLIFPIFEEVIVMPVLRDASQCPAGSKYSYSVKGTIQLVCTPCPENTFNEKTGSAVCLPCGATQHSRVGSTKCEPFPWWKYVAIVVAILLLVPPITCLYQVSYVQIVAPTGDHVALGIVGVQIQHSKLFLHNFVPIQIILVDTVNKVAKKCGVYVSLCASDVCIVAADTAEELYEFCSEFHDEAENSIWPVSVSLKIIIHVCSPVVEKRLRDDVETVLYRGPEVNTAIRMFKASLGGSVWCSERTIKYHAPQGVELGRTAFLTLADGSEGMILELVRSHKFTRNISMNKLTIEGVRQYAVGETKEADVERYSCVDELTEMALRVPSFTDVEIEVAREFIFSILCVLVNSLPQHDKFAFVSKVSRRFYVAPPTSTRPGCLHAPLQAVAVSVLRQMEDEELRLLTDRWGATRARRMKKI